MSQQEPSEFAKTSERLQMCLNVDSSTQHLSQITFATFWYSVCVYVWVCVQDNNRIKLNSDALLFLL